MERAPVRCSISEKQMMLRIPALSPSTESLPSGRLLTAISEPVGNGKCQLIYQVGEEVVAKSPVYRTLSSKSLGNETEPPESASDWILQVLQAGQDAVDAAERAEDAAKKAQDTADGATEAINSAATTGIQGCKYCGTSLR